MSMSDLIVRRRLPPLPPLPAARATVQTEGRTLHDDVRDFFVAYLAGLVVFGVMLF